jgi:hypothetical protein
MIVLGGRSGRTRGLGGRAVVGNVSAASTNYGISPYTNSSTFLIPSLLLRHERRRVDIIVDGGI